MAGLQFYKYGLNWITSHIFFGQIQFYLTRGRPYSDPSTCSLNSSKIILTLKFQLSERAPERRLDQEVERES